MANQEYTPALGYNWLTHWNLESRPSIIKFRNWSRLVGQEKQGAIYSLRFLSRSLGNRI